MRSLTIIGGATVLHVNGVEKKLESTETSLALFMLGTFCSLPLSAAKEAVITPQLGGGRAKVTGAYSNHIGGHY